MTNRNKSLPLHRTRIGGAALALALLVGALSVSAGVALRLQYDAIPGVALSDLTNAAAFPSSPSSAMALTTGLRAPVDAAESFGAWMRGFIEAPQTGDYTFWISSDDDAELWLSTDETPANKARVCQNLGWVARQAYTIKPAQQSALIPLVKGRKYYFEVLHKEDLYGDHGSVAWRLPDGNLQDPVPSRNLWPFPVDLNDPTYPAVASKAPAVLADYLSAPVDALTSSTSVTVGQPVELTVTIEASQPAYVQWFSNSVPIAGANLASYRIPVARFAQDGVVYSMTVTNTFGQTSASTTLSVQADGTPLALVDALNLGNPGQDVVVVFSKAVDSATATVTGNYGINNGASVASARMGTTPDTVILRTTGMTAGSAYTLTAGGVKDLGVPAATLASSSIAIEQNLNTWLRLDENSGTTASDASGNGRNGSLFNDIAPGYAGRVSKAMKFGGVTGHARLPSGYADYTTNGLTLAAWVNPATEGAIANWSRIFDLGNGAASDNILFARTGGDNTVTFEVYNGTASGGHVTTPAGTLWINQWQHLVATMDGGGNVVIYRNGVVVASGTIAGAPNAVQRTSNFIGRSNWGGDAYFAGKLDDVRIYDRVLSPGAAMALASGGGPDDSDGSPTVSVTATVPVTALKATPPGKFTVTRTGATTSALTVQYTLGGTATNGVAYTTLSGSVVIPAGTNSAQVLVSPIDYSFQELSQTVVLSLKGDAAYLIGDADSGVVTIQNNDVNPSAILATAENAFGAVANTLIDVWFAAPVANPSATALANYTLLNASGVTLTNAVLNNRNLRVVLSASAPLPAGAKLNVSGVKDPGGNSVTAQIPVRLRLDASLNLVANVYHSPDTRAACYLLCVDGVADNLNEHGFDTFGQKNQTQFAGLQYAFSRDIQAVKVDLSTQFGDGGNWQAQPSVYLLKTPVDTGATRPESNANWVKVAARLVSGSQFQVAGDANPSPNTPLVFDLSTLPASERMAYGWAVGGALGNGGQTFISISELRSYGDPGTNATTGFAQQPQDRTVTEGQRTTFVQVSTNPFVPLSFQWRQNGADIPGATDNNYSIPPATQADDGAQFDVVVSTIPAAATLVSRVAILHVVARTNPPAVLLATLDPSNSVVQVCFDESVEPSSAQTPGNYTFNDSALSVSSVVQGANGCLVDLTIAGVPTVNNLTVTVANVKDLFSLTMGSQVVPVQPLIAPAARVVANQYQQGRDAVLTRSTDGMVQNDPNMTTWTTWGGPLNVSDFVGLGYAQPQVFNSLKVDLGWQFGDGGDWALQPRVFIQKLPLDSNQTQPETGLAGWVEVPAALASGNVFSYAPDGPADIVPPPNSPIVFDLSKLPLDQRVGYAWAVGGVRANGPNAQFVSLAELRAFGQPAAALVGGTGAPQVILNPAPAFQTLPVTFPLNFETVVAGAQPMYYQWLHNGAKLSDDGRITGAQSPVLKFVHTVGTDAGQYQLVVTNAVGSNVSTIATLALGPIALDNGGGWTVNGVVSSALITDNVLKLTLGGLYEARSAFLNYPLRIRAFRASFVYEDVGGGGADGAAFVIQNDPRGAAALGGDGGGLGFTGITPSAGLEFNIYNAGGIALRSNGTVGAPYAPTMPVDVRSGHPIAVDLRYNGTTLVLTLTDTVTRSAFTTNWVADLPAIVGSERAYVGFTGASGGVASTQTIRDFGFFSEFPSLAIQRASGTTFVISWPVAGGAFVLQQAASLQGEWSDAPDAVSVVGDSNQVTVTVQPGGRFYRLRLP